MQKILIVDDSRGWLNYHVSALKEIFGDEYELEVANCARMGYDMVYNNLKNPYKLIISDLQMEFDFEPKYAGEWFIEQVKKLNEYVKTPIVVISATYNIRTIADSLGARYLSKSVAARDLTSYALLMEEILN